MSTRVTYQVASQPLCFLVRHQKRAIRQVSQNNGAAHEPRWKHTHHLAVRYTGNFVKLFEMCNLGSGIYLQVIKETSRRECSVCMIAIRDARGILVN